MPETVTLEFLAAQQRRILDEIAFLRDDIKVLTAIVLRHEETLIRVLEQMTAMVAQNARIVDRLRALDERVTQLEER
ncbi:MAG TPA: hypothetical protein VJ251_13430 [Stellaceae bacterium]|jgi:hypothetical protein|nr:hypothetical protein [Stellaceae bacterium]HWO86570.1 hypothetical protein [Stellaceae bacterium]